MVVYLEKSEGSEGFHQIIDFLTSSHIHYALIESPTLYDSTIKQFWQTAALCTTEEGVMAITATIDRKVKLLVTEASIRIHLKFEDSKGLNTLPIVEIFEQLALIGSNYLLVQDEGTSWVQEDPEIQEKISDDTEVVLEEEEPTRLVEDQGSGEKGEKEVSIVGAEHSTVILEVSTAVENLYDTTRQEQEVVAEAAQTHDIDWSDLAVIRYHAVQNRSFSKAKVRKNICMYLKNQGGYKMSHFNGMSYEDIRPIFEKVWDQNHAFVPKDSEIEKEVMKRSGFDLQQESTQKTEKIETKQVEEEIVQQEDVVAERVVLESSKKGGGRRKKSLARKRARETLSEESAKKQKLDDDVEKEELQVYLNIVSEDESLDVESLATKYPIVVWETQSLANDKYYYQIKRADGSVKHYNIFSAMLYDFDMQDVLELYRLVKERFQTTSPEGYDLLLWGDLKTMIEPNEEDEI
ncbi:hypothetical protein Tco_0218540 [Tanacetum coccineum]